MPVRAALEGARPAKGCCERLSRNGDLGHLQCQVSDQIEVNAADVTA
jgi:hypothetical protein